MNKQVKTSARVAFLVTEHVLADIQSDRPLMRLEEVIDEVLDLSHQRLRHGFVHRGLGRAPEFYTLMAEAVNAYRRVYRNYESLDLTEHSVNAIYEPEEREEVHKSIATRAWWQRSLFFLDRLEGWTCSKSQKLSSDELPYSDNTVLEIIEKGLHTVLGPDFQDGPVDADTGAIIWNHQDNKATNFQILGSFISLMETYA